MLFLCYSKCSTCKKAKKHLDSLNIKYEERDIVLDKPNYNELKKWIKDSNTEIRKFFNTSGVLYRELKLSSKLDQMSYDEMIKLLSSDGKLVKRPLLIKDNKEVIVGYKAIEYEKIK